MIEILIAKAFDATSSPVQRDFTKAMAPPVSKRTVEEAFIHEHLNQTETMLGRVHWVVANGTLPAEDREQVIKLAVWSEQLKSWARRLLDVGTREEANQFAYAAHAAAGAAEHVCRKCYVTRYDGAPASAVARGA